MNGTARPSTRPRFQTRASSKLDAKGKGKGKASEWGSTPSSKPGSHDEVDESDDDAYVTSNDWGTPTGRTATNGEGKGKEKGKARQQTGGQNENGEYGFQDQADGDNELYS